MEFNRNGFNRFAFNRARVTLPNALYIPKPSLPAFEKYPLRVFNENFVLLAEIDNYESLSWTRRWRSAGEFTLRVSRYAEGADQLDEGHWISIYRGGITRMGCISSMEITTDPESSSSEIWEVKGLDAKGLLQQRIAYHLVGAGTGYDTQTTVTAEAACRHYIDTNIISAVNADRRIAELQLATNGGRGGTVSYSARLENLHEAIENILLASPDALGYDILFDPDTTMFTVTFALGNDLHATVQFNTGLGNVGIFHYVYDIANLKNLAYVGDSGLLAARVFTEVPVADPPSGWNRKEAFVDGSDTTTAAELIQKGTAALAELDISELAEFTVVPDNSFTYMTRDAAGDFDIGDIITAVYDVVALVESRIIEVVENYGGSTLLESITLKIGSKKPDLIRFLRIAGKQNSIPRRK